MDEIVTYYLELSSRKRLRPSTGGDPSLRVQRAEIPSPDLNRYLYAMVGRGWGWCDRLPRSFDDWTAYLDRPELETWVAYLRGTPAGFFELERQPGGACEVCIFGVAPFALGRGVGGRLLTFAAERGFDGGARRVWLHTCSRDHPAALQNYVSRGFAIYSVVHELAPPCRRGLGTGEPSARSPTLWTESAGERRRASSR